VRYIPVNRPVRGLRRGIRAQVMIIFALAAIVVLGLTALAVDGGYGLVQYRRAQNAADFGAVAGTTAVRALCQGGAAPTNAQVYNSIQYAINQNSNDTGTNWTAYYLDRNGAKIPSTGTPTQITNDTGLPPATTCGVTLTVTPHWKPYLAGIIGMSGMTTVSSANSVLNPAAGKSIGIVALDQVRPHEVLGGGTGTFDVTGTIFANSSVIYDPWTQTHNGYPYNDVVDAKDNSNLTLHGIMETIGNSWPLDWCFGVTTTGSDNGNLYNATPPVPRGSAPNPYNTPICNGGSGSVAVTLKYDQIINAQVQIPDPLVPDSSGANGVPDPFDTSSTGGYQKGICGAGLANPPLWTTLNSPTKVGTTTVLQPGEYNYPVLLTGNVDFADCTGSYDGTVGTTAYPGIFRFDQGFLAYGGTVRGSNVMVATGSPVPLPGNVPGAWNSSQTFVGSGTGNGAPCFPAGVTNSGGKGETDGTSATCGGTDPGDANMPAYLKTSPLYKYGPMKGVVAYNEATFTAHPAGYGTGTNFSLILSGGAGSTIHLTAPQTGPYRDIAVFQERVIPGNFGLNALAGDQAAITIDGVVYNGSLPCNGYPKVGGACTTASTKPSADPFDYWDVGIPYREGGVMQTGLGSGTNYPNSSAGTVTVNGPCVVGDFNTDGTTTIKIDGSKNSYPLPGVLGSGNPPITG
jgi:hypothetical protein